VLRAAMAGILPDDVRVGRPKLDPGAAVLAQVERLHACGALASMALAEAGILDAAALNAMYREMVWMFAAGQNRYKVLAYRLWTLFTGDCVWRTAFGQDARARSMSAPTEVSSGSQTASAGCR